jgi:WD40 repeat protein
MAKLWDTLHGLLLRTFSGHSGEVTSVAFSPDELEDYIQLYQRRGPSRMPSLCENGAQAAADKLMEIYRG